MFGLYFWCLGLLTIFSLCPAVSYQVYLSDCFVIFFKFFFNKIGPVQLSVVLLTWLKLQALLYAEIWLWQGVFHTQLCHQVVISFTILTASSLLL